MEEKKVEYLELFYDLIFVYCISRLTVLLEPVTEHFTDFSAVPVYLCCFICILQCWVFTAILMNRYGYRQISDYVCIFINMFLLYLMADGITEDIEYGFIRFHVAWALLLLNLAVQFAWRKHRHECMDGTDDRIIRSYLIVLLVESALGFGCAAVYAKWGLMLTPVAFCYGLLACVLSHKVFALRPLHSGHFAERISLLIVVTFGEMIVGITSYFGQGDSLFYAITVFLVVIGLFLLYFFDFYNLQDHSRIKSGIGFMFVHVPIILSLNNITVALSAMTNAESPLEAKSLYLAGSLVIYMLSLAALILYHKPEFTQKSSHLVLYLLADIAAFAAFLVLMVATHFRPDISVLLTVGYIYTTLALMYARYVRHRVEKRIEEFCEIRW